MAGLSRRQQEVADLVIVGMQNKHIAHQLGISICTVKHHLNLLFLKFRVHNRTTLVARLREQNFAEAAE